jgi:hypothetical protein
MSFRHLTSGERKRLQQGILSPEEATKVSIRAGEKAAQSPDALTRTLGAVRVVAKGVASFYGAGGLVESVEKMVGGPTPTQQLGLTPMRSRGGPAPALPPRTPGGLPPMALPFSDPGYEASASGLDWLGGLSNIAQTIAPIFYPSSRRGISPMSMDDPSAAPRALPGPAGPIQTGIIRVILYKVRQHLGRSISLSGIAALVRRLGPAATAVGLGIALEELATLIFHHETRKARRRRRGISARDITRARSTIVRMTRFMGRVQEACAPVGHVRHRRRLHRPGCGCIVCRRAA